MAFNKVTCGDHNQNLYCGCYDDRGVRVDQEYIQWNKESQKFVCCNKVDFSPSAITSGTYGTVSEYLYDAGPSGTDVSDCDYMKYTKGVSGVTGDNNMKENFPDIYYEGLASMKVYNTFIDGNSRPTFIVNSDDNQFSVSCPNTDEVPYVLNFNSSERPDNYPDYITICTTVAPNIDSITEVDLGGNYFIDNQGAECSLTNQCSLDYSPGNYHVLGNKEPNVVSKPSRNVGYIITFSILSVVLIGVLIVLGIMFHKPELLMKYTP